MKKTLLIFYIISLVFFFFTKSFSINLIADSISTFWLNNLDVFRVVVAQLLIYIFYIFTQKGTMMVVLFWIWFMMIGTVKMMKQENYEYLNLTYNIIDFVIISSILFLIGVFLLIYFEKLQEIETEKDIKK